MSAKITRTSQIVANGTKQTSFMTDYKSILSLIAKLGATPAARNFAAAAVTVASDTIALDASEMYTGYLVRLTTTDTLPAPLLLATNYYVIKVDQATIKLATSLANAQAGTAINLTDQGVGTHTATAHDALATVTVTVEGSNDPDTVTDADATWVQGATPVAVTTTAVKLEFATWTFARARVVWAAASGQGIGHANVCVKTHGQA